MQKTWHYLYHFHIVTCPLQQFACQKMRGNMYCIFKNVARSHTLHDSKETIDNHNQHHVAGVIVRMTPDPKEHHDNNTISLKYMTGNTSNTDKMKVTSTWLKIYKNSFNICSISHRLISLTPIIALFYPRADNSLYPNVNYESFELTTQLARITWNIALFKWFPQVF